MKLYSALSGRMEEIFKLPVRIEPLTDKNIESCKVFLTGLQVRKEETEEGSRYLFSGTAFAVCKTSCGIDLGFFVDRTLKAPGQWDKEESVSTISFNEKIYFKTEIGFKSFQIDDPTPFPVIQLYEEEEKNAQTTRFAN